MVPQHKLDSRQTLMAYRVRLAVGVWLLLLSAVIVGWRSSAALLLILLVPAACLHFFLAYRLRHDHGSQWKT